MNTIQIVKKMKEAHKDSIVLIKIGSFYHVYSRDAYILSYLFDYKLKQLEKDYITCGFPINSINKVIECLKEKQVNYIIVKKDDNYEITSQTQYGKQNNYKTVYEKSRIYVITKTRISNIYNYLEESIFDEGIKELLLNIENLIDERKNF